MEDSFMFAIVVTIALQKVLEPRRTYEALGHLFHFAGGRTHGGGLLGLGVNADQRDSAHSIVAGGNHVSPSP